jgi:hypothetical protein
MSLKTWKQESKHRDPVIYSFYQLLKRLVDKLLHLAAKYGKGTKIMVFKHIMYMSSVPWFMSTSDQMIPSLSFLYAEMSTNRIEIYFSLSTVNESILLLYLYAHKLDT